MPTPSDQPVPSAAAAKALQRPSARQPALAAELDELVRGRHHRHPARQRQRALARAQRLAARCIATSEEEQAVSTVTAGPSSPSA